VFEAGESRVTDGDCGFPAGEESMCRGCGVRESCEMPVPPGDRPYSGSNLIAASGLFFGIPVLLALLGAAISGASAEAQLVGGAGGLLLGMLATSWVAGRLEGRRGKEGQE